jgi:hypothetical protein
MTATYSDLERVDANPMEPSNSMLSISGVLTTYGLPVK